MGAATPEEAAQAPFLWWKHGVIYQVYPRSFQDTNGDGVGDLQGVIDRLDYLVALGVDALWLCPVYRSPMRDFGYDVADHVSIDPLFGDLETFDRLVRAVHQRGLRLILDYIPNHCSDRHLWFYESRSNRTNPRRDFFIWRDPAPDGGPPNNWRSEFGGPAWTLDKLTGQYYYHAFLPSQPDFNWRNPHVQEALLIVLSFWLNRGVDGFRVDAIHHLFEAEDLADNPPNPAWRPGRPPAEALLRTQTVDRPEVHDAVAAMRRVTDRYEGDRVLIGEAYLPIERLMAYYGGALDGFHLPFNFHLMETPWTPKAIAALVEAYERQLPPGGWPNWVLGNHDRSRLASRIGPGQVKVAALLLMTLRGTPTIYQGEELGLADVPIPPDRVRDPWELNVPGLGLGRDPVRAPMPWSAADHAGFSTGEPWLPLSPDWREINAARQGDDPASVLSFYRRLLALRRRSPALTHGSYRTVAATEGVLAYERADAGERLLVVLNLTSAEQAFEAPPGEILLDSARAGVSVFGGGALSLRSGQGLILSLTARRRQSSSG
jgi:alpha-glucosidase